LCLPAPSSGRPTTPARYQQAVIAAHSALADVHLASALRYPQLPAQTAPLQHLLLLSCPGSSSQPVPSDRHARVTPMTPVTHDNPCKQHQVSQLKIGGDLRFQVPAVVDGLGVWVRARGLPPIQHLHTSQPQMQQAAVTTNNPRYQCIAQHCKAQMAAFALVLPAQRAELSWLLLLPCCSCIPQARVRTQRQGAARRKRAG
jgi:hypothetical protein